MHVAAFNPVAVTAEQVPAELVAKEKKSLKQKQLNLVNQPISLKNGIWFSR